MSDWLDEVAQEVDIKRQRLDEIELQIADSFNALDRQVSGVLQEAIDFINKNGDFRAGEIFLRTNAPPGALVGWSIYQDWEGERLSLYFVKAVPVQLFVGGSYGPGGSILVSEYSDEWLRGHVLPVVRRLLGVSS